MKCMPKSSKDISDSERPVTCQALPSAAAFCVPYLNSIPPSIYRDPLQTLLRKPSFCESLFRLSSLSPMARTKPLRA
jgi:hypothetical protein